jgi:hypothetical protein
VGTNPNLPSKATGAVETHKWSSLTGSAGSSGSAQISAILSLLLCYQPCDKADSLFEMFPHRSTSSLRIPSAYRVINRFVPFQDFGRHIRDK